MTTTFPPPIVRQRAIDRPHPPLQLEIDPRIRQRWLDNRRAAARRRLKIVSAAMSVVLVALVILGVLHTPAMRVRHVRIFGVTAAELPQLSAAGGFDHQRLMVDIDVSDVARALEAIPWVDTAKVTRVWPSTVRISVTTRTAVGQVLRAPFDPSRGVALVDRTGRVLALRPASSAAASLPFLQSVRPPGVPGTWLWGAPGAPKGLLRSSKKPSGSVKRASVVSTHLSGAAIVSSETAGAVSPDTAEVLETAAAIPTPIIGRVNSVGVISGQLEVMVGSTEVVLGTTANLAEKMVSLQTVVSEVDLTAVSQVDLEVPDRPALTATPHTASVSSTS